LNFPFVMTRDRANVDFDLIVVGFYGEEYNLGNRVTFDDSNQYQRYDNRIE
jgi:hypothetical protein